MKEVDQVLNTKRPTQQTETYFSFIKRNVNHRMVVVMFSLMVLAGNEVKAQTYASLPYSTGFEGGSFDASWTTTSSTGSGSIVINTAQTPNTGTYHLTMATSVDDDQTINEASLHLDLSGETGVRLSFWWEDYGDENNGEDGIYFSDDGGSNFTQVYLLEPESFGDNTYRNIILDVDALAAGAGLSLTSTFVIKFQQNDNYPLTYDGMGFDDISVVPQAYASLPYSTSFESGSLDTYWIPTSSTGDGEILVNTAQTPNTGTYHLTMATDGTVNNTTNEAWLHLNLAGESGIQLSFWWEDYGDEDTAEDGIYFSDDGGSNFTQVYLLEPESFGDNTYRNIILDIDALASGAGLSLTSSFVIKFQQRDNRGLGSDGIGFDDINVAVQDYAGLPYSTSFESGSLDTYWSSSSSTGSGSIVVNTAQTPNTGTYHLTMATSVDDDQTINEASLHLDLSGETGVRLSFWWEDYGDEDNGEDGIYFSDDGGSNFTQVYLLEPESFGDNTYRNIILDVDALAAGAGLSMTSKFVIKFQQNDNYPLTYDGMGFDDINVVPQAYASLPYSTSFESGSLDTYWVPASSTGDGEILVNTAQTPNTGTYHLTMATDGTVNNTTNEAWLHLNLAGESGIQLSFWWEDYGDEDTAEDGIYFSDDGGSNFTQVYLLEPESFGDNTYRNIILDIDALASGAGLSFTSTFVIKFQQRDNRGLGSDGIGFDDINVGTSDMTYISSTTTQNTTDVNSYSADEHIIGIEVVTIGSSNPIDITAFDLSTNGTTSVGDISNAKIYYTGTSATFATGAQFGSTVGNPNGTFTINGTQTLQAGTNYFWLTYDIVYAATEGNQVDAEVSQITVDGSDYNPTVTAPAGSRTINTHYYAEFPYYTSFENGFIENEWEISDSGGNGRTQVTTANNPRTGAYHLTMDRNANGADEENYADLYIDLSGQTEVQLEFYMQDIGDEDDIEDGIWFSDDAGASFTQVYDINPEEYTDGIWNYIVLDLDALAAANGLAVNSTFVIRFLQRDNRPITDDGITFDDIVVRIPPCNNPGYVTLPYYQGFESGVLGEEWCIPQVTDTRTTITSEYSPYLGNFHLAMDKITDDTGDFPTNEAWLHLDLSSETQVSLEFQWKEDDDENHAEDGIFISDDGGATFSQILTFYSEAVTDNTWTLVSLDIDAEAASAGLSLTNQFVIKFSHQDNRSLNAGIPDGFLFDEIKVFGGVTNWTGNVDNDWEDAGNWDNGVPSCASMAVIPDVSGASNNFPIVGAAGTYEVGNLLIENGASLSVNAGRKLSICRNLANYGNNDVGNGEIEFKGTELQEVIGPTDFGDLTINNTASMVRLVDDITVDGMLTFIDGIVNTNFNNLTINNGADATGSSSTSFVDGSVTKIGVSPANFEFPIGENGHWCPMSITYKNGDAATVFTADYVNQTFWNVISYLPLDPLGVLNNVSSLEYWQLTNTGTATTVDLTLHWKDNVESGIANLPDLRIAHWNGLNWENMGHDSNSSAGGSGSITVEDISSFSPFTFASQSGANPLPVEFLSFEAIEDNGKVYLDWGTATELNNDFFEIQRSEDGENWEVIGQVDGNGTINVEMYYSFEDDTPLFGKSYYRLRQVDLNGEFEYSPVASIEISFEGLRMEVKLFPNPTREDNINIRIATSNNRNDVLIKMYDLSGKTLINRVVKIDRFAKDLKIKADQHLKAGIYLMEVKQGEFVSKHKIIIAE